MNLRASLVLLLGILFSCSNPKGSGLEARKEKISAMENLDLTEDQLARKNKSIAYCKNYGIPTIEHLPAIESEEQTTIRSKDEIINRTLAICYLGLKSEGLEEKHLIEFADKYEVRPHFSKNELAYVNAENPTQQQAVNANWRYESMHVLLWSLGFIDSLKYPSEVCNVAEDVKIIFSRSRKEFADASNLRSKDEILDAADLIYRIHWATVNARIKEEDPPANLYPSIVYERHYVLNWLINYLDQDWDDVSTDT